MILFCGIPSEPSLALAVRAAEAAGIAHVVFNQRDARFSDIMLEVRDGRVTGTLWTWEKEWRLEEFTGVYNRLIESSLLPENRPRGRRQPDPWLMEKSTFLHHV